MADSVIYLKTHETDKGSILAMCDSELIDSVLGEGDVVMDIKSYAGFYMGELVDSARAKEVAGKLKIFSANIVGKESVEAAIGCAVIREEHVRRISGVPYAQAFRVEL